MQPIDTAWIAVLEDGQTFTDADGCEVRVLTAVEDELLIAGEPLDTLGTVIARCAAGAHGVEVSTPLLAPPPAGSVLVFVLADGDTYSTLHGCTLRRLERGSLDTQHEDEGDDDDDLAIEAATVVVEFQVLKEGVWGFVTTLASGGLG